MTETESASSKVFQWNGKAIAGFMAAIFMATVSFRVGYRAALEPGLMYPGSPWRFKESSFTLRGALPLRRE